MSVLPKNPTNIFSLVLAMSAAGLTREEALAEIARLKRKLERRRRREEVRAKIERSNREWNIGGGGGSEENDEPDERAYDAGQETVNNPGERGDGPMLATSSPRVPGHEETAAGFVLASQLPFPSSATREDSQTAAGATQTQTQRKRRASQRIRHSSKKAKKAVRTRGDLLSGLRVLDANTLDWSESPEVEDGFRFRLPQPNADRLLRSEVFSLPKDYTGLKLEAGRMREVLQSSQCAATPEQEEEDLQASQSILATKRKRRGRPRKKTSANIEVKVPAPKEDEEDDDFGSVDVSAWSQFCTQKGKDSEDDDEEDFLRSLLGPSPPPQGWKEAARAKDPLFR